MAQYGLISPMRFAPALGLAVLLLHLFAIPGNAGIIQFTSDPGVAFPTSDSTFTASFFQIPATTDFIIGPGNSVTVTLSNFSHPVISTLTIELVTSLSPSPFVLMSGRGGSCGFDPLAMYAFNSQFTTLIPGLSSCRGDLPSGNYKPVSPAWSGAFDGQNISGTFWGLMISDGIGIPQSQPDGWLFTIAFDGTPVTGQVPEPSTVAMVFGALAGIGIFAHLRSAGVAL